MKEAAFERLCGNCDGININDITVDDVRAQADYYRRQFDADIEYIEWLESLAIEYINERH